MQLLRYIQEQIEKFEAELTYAFDVIPEEAFLDALHKIKEKINWQDRIPAENKCDCQGSDVTEELYI